MVLRSAMIEAICRLPQTLRAREDSSWNSLLTEVGFIRGSTTLDPAVIVSYLEAHPDLIEAWLGYSEDKRTSSGWYITQAGAAGYEIGHFPHGPRLTVATPAAAVAQFIVRELSSMSPTTG
jgi:hypothetical protein